MTEMQEQTEYKIHLSMPATILIICQIIFAIFIVISIPRLYQPDEINDEDTSRIPVTSISNFFSFAPDNYSGFLEGIEMTLFKLIIRNSPGRDVSTSISAVIREDSFRVIYFEDENVNYISAIVDIPNIEQSYWFYNEFSNDKDNKYIDYSKTYRIFCLEDYQEIIYPNFECKDDFGSAGRPELISDLINYFDFDHFKASYSFSQDSNEIQIHPNSFKISDEEEITYIQQAKDAITSLGISPDLFTYNVVRY